jgi:hypothetical protein
MAVAITDASVTSVDHSWHRLMTHTLRIVLELEPDADPVHGRLFSDGSKPRPFDGYVQLIGLIEALQHPDRGRETDNPPERTA